MAIYYQDAGPYVKFLQNQSYVNDIAGQIKETGQRIQYTISEETKKLVASNEMLAETFHSSFDKINGTLEWGFGRVEHALNNVKGAIESLHAMLDDHLTTIIHNQEVQIMMLEGIWDEIQIPEFKREQRYYIQKGYELYRDRMIEPALKCFLRAEASEEYFAEYKVLETIGHIYLGEATCHNAEKALDYFTRAAKFAEPEHRNPHKASEFYMHAGYAAYLLKRFNHAIALDRRSLVINKNFSRAWYLLAKYHACLKKSAECNHALENAISFDRKYCILADIDGDFTPVKKDVLVLFEKLRINAINQVKPIIAEAKGIIDEISLWGVTNENATKALNNFSKAQEKFSSRTFFDCTDAMPLAQETINYGRDAVKERLKQLKEDYDRALRKLNRTLTDAHKYQADKFAKDEFDRAKQLAEELAACSWQSPDELKKHHRLVVHAQTLANNALINSKRSHGIESRRQKKSKAITVIVSALSPLVFTLIGLFSVFSQEKPHPVFIVAGLFGPGILATILTKNPGVLFTYLLCGFVLWVSQEFLRWIFGAGASVTICLICLGLIAALAAATRD